MKLKIKPFSKVVKKYYLNHGHFHDGDAGLDLFIINDQTINSGDSAKIHLQISCENLESKKLNVVVSWRASPQLQKTN